jgi:hypothetical protein
MNANHPLPVQDQDKLTQATLAIVNTMVSHGYTFFSSVKTDTLKHECAVKVDYAMMDSMFFHRPDTGLMLQIKFYADLGNRYQGDAQYKKQLASYLRCQVMLETKRLIPPGLFEYRMIMELARERGYIDHRYLSNYDGEKSEFIDLPFVHRPPGLLYWTAQGGSASHRTDSSLHVQKSIESNRTVDHDYSAALKELVNGLEGVMPFIQQKEGFMFEEVLSSTFWPISIFPTSEHDFWEQFNSRYFRKLVKYTH